jgi:uncharacterized protein YbjT (DUF2867 family)
MSDNVLVAGATGGLGQHVAQKLLRINQPSVALVRNISKARTLLGSQVSLIAGDTRKPGTLTTPMQGVRYVICATGTKSPLGGNSPEHVDYEGVRNLVEAARVAHVERFVLVSSIAVTKPDHPLNAFGKVLTWKLKGEESLRSSGLAYTIVRPGGLTDEPGGYHGLKIDQGDRIMGRISRADVAEVCIQALRQPATCNATFEVVETDGSLPTDWASFFAALKSDETA